MSSACPFSKAVVSCDGSSDKDKNANATKNLHSIISPKCPFGYDSQTFKLGPLSCIICQALLYDCTKCIPCSHKFCKVCIQRFKDCPLCGTDIENIEADADLQATVDRFIDGHARIKRCQFNSDAKGAGGGGMENVIYEDVSMERGTFLVQQAMRAFRAQNIESAKSRLSLCVEDLREQFQTSEDSQQLCSQLGAVLGMLGDCSRASGDNVAAVAAYTESVTFLQKLPAKDMELVHTLSVSLNKIGDVKYYDGDLISARDYYTQSLEVRRSVVKENWSLSSQIIDMAVSLAKVADVDRALGDETAATMGFEEAMKCLETLELNPVDAALEHRRQSVLAVLHSQVAGNQNSSSNSSS